MLPLHAALVKGFFAEEGLNVQGSPADVRAAFEQGKPHGLWINTDGKLTEPDFGFIAMDQLHHVATGEIDYYVVDGLNFGCQAVLVPPDSPVRSTADLKGKTIAIIPTDVEPFFWPHGGTFLNRGLGASGLEAWRDVSLRPMPWDALPRLGEYLAEGTKRGEFDAIHSFEPVTAMLEGQNLARVVFSQGLDQYCCLFGIKRAIVDGQPDQAARIVRAFRSAKLWVAENPLRAVAAAQSGGYHPPTPVEQTAARVKIFGYDRQVDLGAMLERAFKERIDAGAIKTDKTPAELVRLHYRRIE
jgi:ABC-type nitrate/sulfonate/bicarbonate transport system substrate-binding protein